MWVIVPSMTADICDKDELDTGTRREGMYSAAYGWFLKTSISVGMLIGGLLIAASRFDKSLEVVQIESSLNWLRALEVGVPIPIVLAGIFLLRKYPLSEERMYEIRAALDRRKEEKPS